MLMSFFLGPHPRRMEVPRLGVYLELQLPAYPTATAMPDSSHVCDRHHSLQQRQILNPLSKARDQTRNLVVPSRICFHGTMMGTPPSHFLKILNKVVVGSTWKKLERDYKKGLL